MGFLSESFGLLNALWLVIVVLALGFLAAGALRQRPTANTRPPLDGARGSGLDVPGGKAAERRTTLTEAVHKTRLPTAGM